MKRRYFLKTGSIATIAATTSFSAFSQNGKPIALSPESKQVKFTRDGLDFSPSEYSALLQELSKDNDIKSDSYSRGGIVKKLEDKMARILGKESAVFMPTGTMANHIAVRELAGKQDRVVVQAESHLYNDSGDCAQKLSGLNLIPLAPGQATFTLDEVKDVVDRTEKGRVKTGVGVISIESPVRRKDNEMFDFKEMEHIAAYSKSKNIRLHLDGARLFNACVHSGKQPKDYAEMFDTVYVSLYKNFNAASGAVLAGTKEFTKDLYHTRRMFGGGMPQVWPFAAVANHYLDSFLDDYSKSLEQAEMLFKLLGENQAFKVEKIPNGTNVFKLHVQTTDRNQFHERLKSSNIILPSPANDFEGFRIKINPTILRSTPDEIAKGFIDAL
jgi:threonine aldolase